MTVVILISLAAGGMVGYFIVPLDFLAGVERVSMLALYMLLFLVGVEIGHNKSAFKNIKNMGKKIIAVTSSIIVDSLLGGLVAGLIFGIRKNVSMAIASGFGWYSLSAVILKEIAGAEIGAIAFMSNVFREMLAFITIPWIAKRLNYCAAIAPAGVTSMDTTLLIISESTDNETAIISFSNGLILSTLVPILVPLIYGLP
jgi:uncharacterized membrane protein YbjE (DUF340 family)